MLVDELQLQAHSPDPVSGDVEFVPRVHAGPPAALIHAGPHAAARGSECLHVTVDLLALGGEDQERCPDLIDVTERGGLLVGAGYLLRGAPEPSPVLGLGEG